MIKGLQRIVWDWGERAFGREHMFNRQVRALRMVEEAIEAAQSVGVPEQQIRAVAHVVYSRPPGKLYQELGGTLITLSVMAEREGWQMEDIMLTEVQRCLAKGKEHFTARNQEKLDLGLTGTG